MIVNIKGEVTEIFPIEQKTEKFSTKKFIVEVFEQEKAQKFVIQTTNSRCSLLENIKIGDIVSIDAELNSKEYTNKQTGEKGSFLTLNAVKINPI